MKVAKKNICFVAKTSEKYIYNKIYTKYADMQKDIENIKNTCEKENNNKDIAESVKSNNTKIIEKLSKILENHKESKLIYIVNNLVKMYIDKDNTMYCDAVYVESVASRFALDSQDIQVIGQAGQDIPSQDITDIVALCSKEK